MVGGWTPYHGAVVVSLKSCTKDIMNQVWKRLAATNGDDEPMKGVVHFHHETTQAKNVTMLTDVS